MKIICHRGLWKKKVQQNGKHACVMGQKIFDGIEIDLKNYAGDIVLSHDPIKKGQTLTRLEDLFKESSLSFYALNIKEDGLGPQLKKLIIKYKIKNYMCFDLSRPEWVTYRSLNLQSFDRFGDQDPLPPIIDQGLVVDIFNQRSYTKVFTHLAGLTNQVDLFVISPELHGHDPILFWKKLKKLSLHWKGTLYLCTDHPQDADLFFK
jgi:hypothetical protein